MVLKICPWPSLWGGVRIIKSQGSLGMMFTTAEEPSAGCGSFWEATGWTCLSSKVCPTRSVLSCRIYFCEVTFIPVPFLQ